MIPFPFQLGQLGNPGNRDGFFSNVSLLVHGNGANGSTTIVDSSRTAKTPTLFGNAQISTAQSKFGGSSIAYDGTGDCVLYPYSTDTWLTGDFTIEMWVYPSTITTAFLMNHGGGTGIGFASVELLMWNTGKVNFAGSSANSSYDIGSESGATGEIGTVTASVQNHIAVTRAGNVYRGFVNGVQGYTQTLALTPFNTVNRGMAFGANFATTWGSGTPTNSLNGYLDDIRITKGAARYIANFAPPTFEFPNA